MKLDSSGALYSARLQNAPEEITYLFFFLTTLALVTDLLGVGFLAPSQASS